MLKYLGKRMLQALPILFGISLVVFALVNLTPGNPYAAMFDPDLPPEQVDAMLRQVGYYDPLPVKYLKWLGRTATGDLGFSVFYKEPVAAVIGGRIGNTVFLGLAAILISVFIGIPVGITTALRRGSVGDYLSTAFVFMGLSFPTFFLGMLLIKLFGRGPQAPPHIGHGFGGSFGFRRLGLRLGRAQAPCIAGRSPGAHERGGPHALHPVQPPRYRAAGLRANGPRQGGS